MPHQPVLLAVHDRIATITLNRPEARNALNREVLRLVPELMAQADADPAVDVLVLTGTDPAFTAGLDLKDLGAGTLLDEAVSGGVRKPFPALTKPLIGAVNGVAVTGGFEYALNCDMLIASDRARFADTHARVGVMPAWGLSVLLPQAIGVRRARELSLTGRFIDAATAYEWGLVNRVVPHEQLMTVTYEIANEIVGNDQDGVRRMLATYADHNAQQTEWEHEAAIAADWKRTRFSAAEVAARRAAIQERGRSLTSGAQALPDVDA